MELIKLTEHYNNDKKQLLFNLIHTLESTTKNVKKGKKKKSAQNFFILKHVTEYYKKSKVYYQNLLV
jgi:hypothetical protein